MANRGPKVTALSINYKYWTGKSSLQTHSMYVCTLHVVPKSVIKSVTWRVDATTGNKIGIVSSVKKTVSNFRYDDFSVLWCEPKNSILGCCSKNNYFNDTTTSPISRCILISTIPFANSQLSTFSFLFFP